VLEFNATLLAQIIDFIIIIIIFCGLIFFFTKVVLKRLFSHDKLMNNIETIATELKEIRKILEERKH